MDILDIDSWQFSLQTEVGWLLVQGNRYFVTSAAFSFQQPGEDFGSGQVYDKAREQLQAYLDGRLSEFDLPVMTSGTDFQQRTWTALEEIPAGQTVTYGQLAQQLDSSPRAVGGACRENPVAVIVPCHRVVSMGGIGGYAGDTSGENIDVKNWLLQHEAQRH